ncbi:MAG TPA: hypothetical protein VF142_08670 [Longimicrobium sp.]
MTRSLLEDDSLALRVEPDAWSSVEPWVPRIPARAATPERARAWIEVEPGAPAFGVPTRPPAVDLCSVAGWPERTGEMLLCAPRGWVSAIVDPGAHHARVRLLPPGAPAEGEAEAFRVEAFATLTLAAAFLLGRLRRTLVHAGAVVAPDGRAWLLAGGTFSGKSTTCVSLIRGGWDWLADDNVVLNEGPRGLRVEGWPRRFNLDHGYAAGASQGVRSRVDPEAFGPGRWRRAAPLGGLLFPRVEAERPTALEPLSGVDALSGLLQQSPWLLGDPGTAQDVLALVRRAAAAPAFELRLGADSYRDPEQLQRLLVPAFERYVATSSTA